MAARSRLLEKPTHRRYLGVPVLIGSLFGVVLTLPSAASHASEPLDELGATLHVCSQGPDAAVARAARVRGAAQVTAASVLPNPSLVAEHQRTLRGSRERETVVGVSIPLGLGGE